ncbi:MAG: methylated-DNA--[protein]-cysteine S-methyltransferase [Promethearchaeota archaeon]
MFHLLFDTAFGTSGIIYRSVEDGGVVHILLPGSETDVKARIKTVYPESTETQSRKIQGLIRDIVRYLRGEPVKFSMDLIDTSVCYPFQLKVLTTERTIPRGMTATYGWVASKINTKGVRAVGNALARNPFPLVVPCHRAVRSDRTLGGFQGGLYMKRALLEMEGVEFDSKGRVEPDFLLSDDSVTVTIRNDQHFGSLIWLI